MESSRSKQFVSFTLCVGQSSVAKPRSVPLGVPIVPPLCPCTAHRAIGFSERESMFIIVCCYGWSILLFLLLSSCLIYKLNFSRGMSVEGKVHIGFGTTAVSASIARGHGGPSAVGRAERKSRGAFQIRGVPGSGYRGRQDLPMGWPRDNTD